MKFITAHEQLETQTKEKKNKIDIQEENRKNNTDIINKINQRTAEENNLNSPQEIDNLTE